jgi:hypothetical protein
MDKSWEFQEAQARKRGHELAMLRLRWHEAYGLTWDEEAKHFVAKRRDDEGEVRADNAVELETKIQNDYAEKPVPRAFRLGQSEHT